MSLDKNPTWRKVSPYKKPFHLARMLVAKKMAKMVPQANFIGITGSVGKTTTAQCCNAVLSEKFVTLVSTSAKITNLDPIFNIPMTLLKIRPKTEKIILEMGIEYPGDMDFNLSFIQPGTGIFTRAYFGHSEFLGGLDKIVAEKSKLVSGLPKNGFAILNWDDQHIRKVAEETKAEVIFFGTDQKQCHVWAGNVRIENYHTLFELNYGVERVEVKMKLLGKHFITSALAAAALGVSCKMSLIQIKRGLEKVTPTEHRLQLLDGLNDFVVLDDTYNNASPIGMEAALDVLNSLPARHRIAVIGEMRELGEFSEELHRKVAQAIFRSRPDYLFLGLGETKFIKEEILALGFPEERLEQNLSNQQIVSTILKVARRGDLVLIKGSRSTRLEEVVRRVSKSPAK